MSHIDLIIEERAADIGNFLVGRLLPFRQKRMVGPFIYIDHMGPMQLDDKQKFNILAHPHIGLSTLTFLLEGSIMHRDSLGTEMLITPEAVNWMTAGHGIVHSERSPKNPEDRRAHMHGLQIWIALPKELQEMNPEFHHIEAEHIPKWSEGQIQYRLIAGEAFGEKSPVPVHSPLYMIEITSQEQSELLSIGEHLYGESGLYILKGGVIIDGKKYETRQMLVTKDSHLCSFTILPDSIIYIFGGEPFPEERIIDWNFVSTDQALIDAAKEKWQRQEFPPIRGEENEFIPYPTLSSNIKKKSLLSGKI